MKSPTIPIENSEGCVARTTKIIGNKWTPLILRDLAGGSRRFCQLEDSLGSISPRTLSARLDDLVCFGVIVKKTFAEKPPRVEYTLTKKGEDLLPILKQMATWGTKYQSD